VDSFVLLILLVFSFVPFVQAFLWGVSASLVSGNLAYFNFVFYWVSLYLLFRFGHVVQVHLSACFWLSRHPIVTFRPILRVRCISLSKLSSMVGMFLFLRTRIVISFSFMLIDKQPLHFFAYSRQGLFRIVLFFIGLQEGDFDIAFVFRFGRFLG